MAASLFTFSSTSRRVVLAPNSPPLPIYIKAIKLVFNPDIPDVHRGLGLDDFVNFLVSCRLRYTISDVPSEFFLEQVCEFYYTAMVNDENNVISGTIGRGRHSVFITADLLNAALRLPIFEPFCKLPTIERCRRLFDQLGYDHSKAGARSALILRQCMTPGWKLPIFEPFCKLPTIERCRCLFDQLGYDHSKAGARSALILRQCMTPGWKFFTGALCKCVGHKSRSGDQLSTYEQQVVCSLLLNKRLDYGAFFFDQLVQLLRANVRADHVPFPRWIALVLDKFFVEAYYSHSRNPIQCPRMLVRMYQDDPMETDIGISDQMREWIANPYTVPSLTANTDEGADDNNEDHADQQDKTVHSTQGEQPSHGEQRSQVEHPSQGAQPSPGEQPRSHEVPGTQFLHISASAFNELLTLTRDMSQRLLRIEADVHQLKGVLLPTPSPGPQHDDDQKGGETDDDKQGGEIDDDQKEGDIESVELGSEDNILN
ncbi:unnamed protein product [Lactuca saligna]|uniref:Uncharacterized protein n=1 Tax=Lactuca saligna TaxID=75948 RepID=A0AA35ZT09_LACSI|nr:unnamed protein product [Lactuca saligna]